MISINLSNLDYRYDVYQIVNIFYMLEDISFINEKADININILKDKVFINNSIYSCEYTISKEFTYKEAIKLAVFNFLSTVTGKEFPWGTLIGIRPSKIALALLEKDMKDDEIVEYYKKHYSARDDKAKLCIDIARAESKIVNRNKNTVSIYIGMPFCPTRCSYCSFASNPIVSCSNIVEPYLNALRKEIESISKYINHRDLEIECVYFGGGTPTAVSDAQFYSIMKSIYKAFIEGKKVKEFTVECGRPDSITENKLITMKEFKVHRISINPQTMNDDTLKTIGRNHSVEDVVLKYNMARNLGFDNINMDIIIGLGGEDRDYVKNTCNELYALSPDSITVHGLSIKRASKLHESILNNKASEGITQKEINTMYEKTSELAKMLYMKPYYMYRQKNMFGNMENVGYAKVEKQCIYNIQMIEEKQTIIAAGADAVSKVVFLDENRIERFANVKDVREYINRIDEMIVKKIQLLSSLYN